MPACTILNGQTALVTGATSGIGAASATALADAGARVGINYPPGKKAAAEDVVAQIKNVGGRAVAFESDVSKEDQVRHMFAALVAAFGRLDILVANAGLQRDAAATKMTLVSGALLSTSTSPGSFFALARRSNNSSVRRPLLYQRQLARSSA
jgi:glucose 1-dehydrogenase